MTAPKKLSFYINNFVLYVNLNFLLVYYYKNNEYKTHKCKCNIESQIKKKNYIIIKSFIRNNLFKMW